MTPKILLKNLEQDVELIEKKNDAIQWEGDDVYYRFSF